jgi:hypothetical protein
MTALGEKNRLLCQTVPDLSTVLALLALSDVLTLQTFQGLQQPFPKMRIAGLHQLKPLKIKKHGRKHKSIFRYEFDHLRRIVLIGV